MKSIYFYFVLLFTFALIDVNAQVDLVAGAKAGYMMPTGSLNDRFNGTIGYEVYLGGHTSANWIWTGNLEYYKFDKQNDKKLGLRGTTNDVTFSFPFPDKLMNLQIEGLSANATYIVYRNTFLEAGITFGFGIYRWEYTRKGYSDSLYSGGTLVDVVNVPPNKQLDWSGGFNGGLNLNIKVIDPLSISLSAKYKGIIGELWPALDLDLENVSMFQMFDLKAGIQIKL